MRKVTILVACGSGVATSTVAADEVKALCKEHNIPISLSKCSMTELPTQSQNADIVLTTNNFKGELAVPVLSIMGFVTGINEAKLKKTLVEKLQEIQNA
ncbi:PTS sugar transporter subunit IIB [Candidatus Enterococcus murrayae]|uniref:PTS sugar transporter subunit IIB n=1 Tax=Candidatus Enterococcus murrayae TaxID=2815321 RepID=A0ABS3HFW5_9ENTE|nr:PTS sugar transporter subunit IIB [Enterococcus sp. MJM16]MBO0452341.1 PTS sugar transporter subunit IIB [Enterococcus sp. MJM16]